eukprot:jgi/Galph1/789/GphlegSOOS_G5575.1
MGRVRTKTVKKSARVIIEKYYSKLTLDFQTNKRICDEVALIPSKRLRNKIAGFVTHLMKRIQKGPVRGISLKLQEEERERRMDFVPEVSAVDVDELRIDQVTKNMLESLGYKNLPNVIVEMVPRKVVPFLCHSRLFTSIVVLGNGVGGHTQFTGAEKQALVMAAYLKHSLREAYGVEWQQYFQRVYPLSLWKRYTVKITSKVFLSLISSFQQSNWLTYSLSWSFLRFAYSFGCFEGDNTNYFTKTFQKSFLLSEKCDNTVLIGAASSVAPFLMALRFINKNYKTVQILHPRCSTLFFDAVVSPIHDATYTYNRTNWFPTSLSLHDLSPLYLQQLRETTIIQNPKLRFKIKVAVLIGGPRYDWQVWFSSYFSTIHRFVSLLSQAAHSIPKQDYMLLITVSKRTPPKVVQQIEQLLEKYFGKDEFLFYCGSNNSIHNPYLQYISVADYIVVSSDSVNMISEALSCQCPIFVYDLFSWQLSPISSKRMRIFLNNLFQKGFIVPFQGAFTNNHSICKPKGSSEAQDIAHQIREKHFSTIRDPMSSRFSKIQPEECIFLICDIQERFRSVIYQYPSVIHAAKILLEASELFKIPVIATEQYPKALGHTVEELNTDKMRVFEKTVFSMIVPEVEKALLEHSLRRTAVIVGIETHVCVLQTTIDLLEKGYSVHIVTDGVSSQRTMDRTTAFRRLEQAGAWLTTYESLLFQLMRTKDHPSFKQVSELCKRPRPDPGLNSL